MEDVKIGEYVRTKKGQIDKFEKYNENRIIVKCKRRNYWAEDIVKHSKNIIDLIDVGDILRYKLKGLKSEYITVVKKYHDSRSNEEWLIIDGYKLEKVEILEILTKEQYERNCYKVEE